MIDKQFSLLLFLLGISFRCDAASGLKRTRAEDTTHPLDPLSAAEITLAVNIIKGSTAGNIPWHYQWVTLQEPKKTELLPFYLSDTTPPNSIPRRAFCILIDPSNGAVVESIVNLNTQRIENWAQAPMGVLPMAGLEEQNPLAIAIVSNDTVQARLAKVGVTNLSLVAFDPWFYGYAGDQPQYQGKRIAQFFLDARKYELDNFYAHPPGFVTIVNALEDKVVQIQDLPIQDADFGAENRNGERFAPVTSNYDPTVLPASFYRPRQKRIVISQPEGQNFKLTGNLLEWENFKLRIGFNGREGLILHWVSYNDHGNFRPLIYRAAISELFIAYGDPRPPYHRLMGFDVGQPGIGQYANELQLETDCKGLVTFLPVTVHLISGQPKLIRQAICIYEEDAGILWKKTDPLNGRAVSTRSQRLVISSMSTLGNYDYRFNWHLYQDASIQMHIQLTGIVHPNFVADPRTEPGSKYNTRVGDNVNVPFHQHFFTFRIDPEIDGNQNSVYTFDVLPESCPTGSASNPYGNGFKTKQTLLKTAAQGRTKTVASTGRTWLIQGNDKSTDRFGQLKGYKLIPEVGPGLFLKRDSPLHPQCAFVEYNVWVTRYADDQLYAGGLYLNNSGLPQWVRQSPGADIENEDIVFWHVFGVTHVPRTEDWPVMPVTTSGFLLKPNNFFNVNPALDIPPSVFDPRKSTLQ